MKPRHKRAALIIGALVAISLAAYFILNALESNLNFAYSPSDILAGKAPKDRTLRVAGMVKMGSVKRTDMTVNFIVTDMVKEISVNYTGILPDLFKEGKGVVAQGTLGDDGVFRAREVLAKHDENYMPPEAAAAVDQANKAREMSAKTLKQ